MRVTIAIIAMMFVLTGCAASDFRPFHSRAGIPSFSEFTKTNLQFVTLEGEKEVYGPYGIFVGIDNDTIPYVLVAPKYSDMQGFKTNPYYFFNFNRAATLNTSQVAEFVKILARSIDVWDEEYDYRDATYFEYYVTQEHDREQVSEHVVVDDSSLRYWCQINSKGVTAYMWFGEGVTRIGSEFSLKETRRLKALLEKSLESLEGRQQS